MKLKLLIVPIIITLMGALLIWVLWPNYVEFQMQRKELKKSQEKLNDMQEKTKKADALKAELQGEASQKEVLRKYIPVTAEEESIIENLRTLALGEGLFIDGVSFSNSDKDTSGSTDASVVVRDAAGITASIVENGEASEPVQEASASMKKEIIVSTEVVGSYEKIKSFLQKLSNLKRFNNVVSLKISKLAATVSAPATGNLQADLAVNFVYQKEAEIVNVNNNIFTDGKFNTEVVEKLKRDLKTDVVKVEKIETGRQNPFTP
jgi:Tfp pilus assembly protein PilO